jgi:hypothetical protein
MHMHKRYVGKKILFWQVNKDFRHFQCIFSGVAKKMINKARSYIFEDL